MLFSTNNFEEFFANRVLKSALKIFNEDRIVLSARYPGPEFHFLTDGATRLVIKKRAEKILSYTCSCGESSFCSHLGAALFYFQQDSLSALIRKRQVRPVSVSGSFSGPLKDQGSGFYTWSRQLKTLLEPYRDTAKLSQKQLNDIVAVISELKKAAGAVVPAANKIALGQAPPALYFLQLAIVSELPLVFNQRIQGDEAGIRALLHSAVNGLTVFYQAGLSDVMRKAWHDATLMAGKIKNHAGFDIFTKLLPGALLLAKKQDDLDGLKSLVHRRRRILFTTNQLNSTTVAKCMVSIAEAGFNKNQNAVNGPVAPEYWVARADFAFMRGENDLAFKELEGFYETVRTNFPLLLQDYCDQLITRAREKNQVEIEWRYLRESMVNGIYINPKDLGRFYKLVPLKARNHEIDLLVAAVRENSRAHVADKVITLLAGHSDPEKLLAEIKRNRHRFAALHKAALTRFPMYDDAFLHLYADQLGDLLADPDYVQMHEQLFAKAEKYLQLLPEEKRQQTVLRVLKKVSMSPLVFEAIKSKYPGLLPEQKKRVNQLRGAG